MLERIAASLLNDSLARAVGSGEIALSDHPEIVMERPKSEAHGDFATGICMTLARDARRPPRKLAELLIANIEDPEQILERAEVAGPGFINLTFRREAWFARLQEVRERGATFGQTNAGGNQRVLLEFVSANPTGPLHVGHGRGAVVGDVLGNVLAAAGFDVTREYYINDIGKQMRHLGASLYHRYRELLGIDEPYPPDCYQGDYILDIAKDFLARHGETLRDADYEGDEAAGKVFRDFIHRAIQDDIHDDLREFGIEFDNWFAESSLYDDELVYGLLDELERKGHIYTDEQTGARKFRTSGFGDDEDRVIIRDNGVPTYFASDVAYHANKFARGFDVLIDIWGADHHGYIPRMRAGLGALGHPQEAFEVLLIQFVNLVRDGVPVSMSTRKGTFVDLRKVREEVGKDAARLFFIMRRPDSQLDFDLELAKRASMDNPVYYVQYGHARICSILRKAEEAGYAVEDYHAEMCAALELPEELELTRKILAYPGLLESCALNREPHHIVFYLQDLVKTFHGYYTRHKHTAKIVSGDPSKRQARLLLVDCLRIVLRNALSLLGVSAPERMYLNEAEEESAP